MPLYLDVPVRAQTTPWECWWACMRMIFGYYGEHHVTPVQISGQFDMSWSPYTMHVARNPFPPEPAILRATPSLWQTFGVPPVDESMELLARLTGFRRIDRRPAAWDGEALEALLRGHGPLMFYGHCGAAFHAFVLTGADGVQACMNDPDGGEPFRESLESFNRRMVNFGVEAGPGGRARVSFHSYNPMYLPRDPAVRDTVNAPAGGVR